jgi:hypothetical protein
VGAVDASPADQKARRHRPETSGFDTKFCIQNVT